MFGLASAGDLPLEPSPPTHKRSRGPDAPTLANESIFYSQEPTFGDPRNVAGSRRLNKEKYLQKHYSPQTNSPTSSVSSPADALSIASEPSFEQSPSFSSPPHYEQLQLPMYSNDLGRLPLHGPFNFVEPHAQFVAQPSVTSSANSSEPRYQTSGVSSGSYTGSLHQQQPATSNVYAGSSIHSQPVSDPYFREMSSLRTGLSSNPVMNTSGLFQLGASATGPTGIQTTYSERNSRSLISAPISGAIFNTPMAVRPSDHPISSHAAPQSLQHHQTLDNLPQRLMNVGVQGIDLGPIDTDLASIWLNAPAGLL